MGNLSDDLKVHQIRVPLYKNIYHKHNDFRITVK